MSLASLVVVDLRLNIQSRLDKRLEVEERRSTVSDVPDVVQVETDL